MGLKSQNPLARNTVIRKPYAKTVDPFVSPYLLHIITIIHSFIFFNVVIINMMDLLSKGKWFM
jgi:hypothetical protein